MTSKEDMPTSGGTITSAASTANDSAIPKADSKIYKNMF
jgi:hypothetical protein